VKKKVAALATPGPKGAAWDDLLTSDAKIEDVSLRKDQGVSTDYASRKLKPCKTGLKSTSTVVDSKCWIDYIAGI
jgi:hypothetical protein